MILAYTYRTSPQELVQTDYVKFKPQQYGGHCGFIDDFKFSSSLYEEIVNKLNTTKS